MSDTRLRTLTGRIFDIQRFSIHDGPGIRTTVFMKGCPLRCIWCHNPESISTRLQLSFVPDRCIGCGHCFRCCPNGAHRMEGDRHVLDRALCKSCGACAEQCYAGALELVGRDATVGDVLDEVLRDKPFYDTSGGGLTLSGGEPLLQIDVAEALLAGAKEHGLHCSIETCGYADFAAIERLLPHTDLFLYDIKETDPARHVEYTGVTNERIVANLHALHDAGATILLRLPIVPGLNDRPDHFQNIALLAQGLPRLLAVQIMPYHRLGTSKQERLGMEPSLPETAAPDKETVAGWNATLRKLGVRVKDELGADR